MLELIAKTIAPARCVGCDREGLAFCAVCQSILSPAPRVCLYCGINNSNGRTCGRCQAPNRLNGWWSLGEFQGALRAAILAMKYQHLRQAADELAAQIALTLPSSLAMGAVVVPAPTASNRWRQRGFGHTERLARVLARRLRLPYGQYLLRKSSQKQVGSTKEKRLQQAKNNYICHQKSPFKVLLIDDVITSGATVIACSEALKNAGTKEVWAVSVARES